MMRRLLSARRLVPLDRLEQYLSGWQQVLEAARDSGGRAWLFRGTDHQDHFLEFLEWGAEAAPVPLPDVDSVASARLSLDHSFGTAQIEEWEEFPSPEGPT